MLEWAILCIYTVRLSVGRTVLRFFYMRNEETWSNAKIQSGMCPRQVKAMKKLLIRGVVRHNVRRSLVVYGCQAMVQEFS